MLPLRQKPFQIKMFNFIVSNNASAEIEKEVQTFLSEWYNDSPLIEVKTSGSTGKPKTITLQKSKMIISAKKTLDHFQIKPNETAFLCLSSSTIAGKMMIIRAIVGELNLVIGPLSSNPLDEYDKQIDFIAMVPLQLHNSLKNNIQKLREIRTIIIGGGVVSDELLLNTLHSGVTAHQTFGMTETISHVATKRIGIGQEENYHALNGIKFSCAHNNQLVIHYPEIGLDSLKTNDIVKLIDEQTFQWKGRADFIINSGGIKLNPEQIEKDLSHLISCAFFIFGLKDPLLGEKIILIIESKTTLNITKEILNKILTKHSIPKEIIYISSFVRTNSGKINRTETVKSIDQNVIKEIL